MHKSWFISDLHLIESQPHITQQFLHFLTQCQAHDSIYILGDLFEAWIGDDDLSLFHQHIIHALQETTKRDIAIYFLPGNRDFLIGKKFLAMTGCQLLDEENKINMYGTHVLLMHGDTLCIDDHAYQKARKKFHHHYLQQIFLLLPLSFRRFIANKIRAYSMQHTRKMADVLMDVNQQEVERIMQKHQVNFLIHGHTHRLATHEFLSQKNIKQRIVLGAWHDQFNAFMWNELGEKKWMYEIT